MKRLYFHTLQTYSYIVSGERAALQRWMSTLSRGRGQGADIEAPGGGQRPDLRNDRYRSVPAGRSHPCLPMPREPAQHVVSAPPTMGAGSRPSGARVQGCAAQDEQLRGRVRRRESMRGLDQQLPGCEDPYISTLGLTDPEQPHVLQLPVCVTFFRPCRSHEKPAKLLSDTTRTAGRPHGNHQSQLPCSDD